MAKKDNKNESKAKKQFFKDFKAELKKVIWPTPKQLANNTTAVVAIVLITAIIVFALDVVFDLGNKYGITHLQSIVNEKFNTTDNTTTDNTNNTDNGETNTSSNTEETTSSDENKTSNEENTTEENTSAETEQTNPEQ